MLKRPCSDCIFRKGSPFDESLPRARVEEIVQALRSGGQFSCHKTTGADGSKRNERFCAGALATMENEGTVMENQMVRIMGRLGAIPDPATIEDREACHETLDDWIDAHR